MGTIFSNTIAATIASPKPSSQEVRLILLCFALAGFMVAKTSFAAESNESDLNFSAEVKPLAFLMNAVPGGTAAAVAGEIPLSKHMVVSAGITHFNWNIGSDIRAEMAKSNDSDPLASRINNTELMTGVRYYGNTVDDTWYAGVLAGYATSYNRYSHNEEKLSETYKRTLGGAEFGYRWLWESGVLLRIAATGKKDLSANYSVDTESSTPAAVNLASDGESRLKKTHNRTSGTNYGLDFGVGYVF